MRNIDKNKRIFFLWLMVYAIATSLIYLFAISPLFSYSYLTTNISEKKLIICFAFFAITAHCLPVNSGKPSSYLFYLIYLINYIPTLLFTWLNDMPIMYAFYLTICVIIIEVYISSKVKGISISIRNGEMLFYLIFAFYIISSLLLIVRRGGINPQTLNIYYISRVRSGNNLSGTWGYLLNWCAKSFSPMFFAYFAYKRKWIYVTIVSAIQLMLYLSYGYKAFLFSIALLVLVAYVLKEKNNFFASIAGLFALIHAASFLLYRLDISKLPLFTFAYRTLYIPAQCQYQYYEFFLENDYLFFSEGFIGKILGIEYPYSLPIGVVVNQVTFGPDDYSNGNTGLFSYGFADCGFLGMILASALLIMVFLVVDNSTNHIPRFIVVAAMSYQMFILNDTNILISLNTGGIIWSVLLLVMINTLVKDDNDESDNQISGLIRVENGGRND